MNGNSWHTGWAGEDMSAKGFKSFALSSFYLIWRAVPENSVSTLKWESKGLEEGKLAKEKLGHGLR